MCKINMVGPLSIKNVNAGVTDFVGSGLISTNFSYICRLNCSPMWAADSNYIEIWAKYHGNRVQWFIPPRPLW